MSSTYIHGTDPAEQKRLSVMNSFLNDRSLAQLTLRGGERVLDLGSGLGQFTRAMARQTGVPVIGIERSEEQLREAKRIAAGESESDLVDFRRGDVLALELKPEEWGSFDIVHTRFVLEHVSDPVAVVRAMVRAAKPGGRIVLEDDDHELMRLWPELPGFQTLWDAYMKTYDKIGNDPNVGRKLVEILHMAGAKPRANTWIFFGSCSGDPIFTTVVENLIGILQTAREAITSGSLSAAAFESTVTSLRDWGRAPDAALWYPMAWAEGTK